LVKFRFRSFQILVERLEIFVPWASVCADVCIAINLLPFYSIVIYNKIPSGYSHPPAKTFEEPAATAVQPEIASPTLPAPLPFINTEELPVDIGAVWAGHGDPGIKCVVLWSPCLDHGILFTNTLPDP
jgi:hypothetical protein